MSSVGPLGSGRPTLNAWTLGLGSGGPAEGEERQRRAGPPPEPAPARPPTCRRARPALRPPSAPPPAFPRSPPRSGDAAEGSGARAGLGTGAGPGRRATAARANGRWRVSGTAQWARARRQDRPMGAARPARLLRSAQLSEKSLCAEAAADGPGALPGSAPGVPGAARDGGVRRNSRGDSGASTRPGRGQGGWWVSDGGSQGAGRLRDDAGVRRRR